MSFRVRTSSGVWFDCEIDPDDPTLGRHAEVDRYLIVRLISSWLALLADSPLVSLCGYRVNLRAARKFRRSLVHDLKSTIVDLSSLSDDLTNSMEVTDFGSIKKPLHTRFFGLPCYKEYEYWYKTGDAEVLRYLFTFLQYGKKAEIQDDTLKADALRKWLDVEERLRCLQFPGWVKQLRFVTEQLLPYLAYDRTWPTFGPKGVAEQAVKGRYAKAYHLELPEPLQELVTYMGTTKGIQLPTLRSSRTGRTSGCFGAQGPINGPLALLVSNVATGRGLHRSRQLFASPRGFRDDKEVRPKLQTRHRIYKRGISRLRFVAKSIKASRSICLEPNAYMLLQQALRRPVESVLRTGPLGRFISIHDQRPNQSMAQMGSLYGTIDTTDLARASDSVSWTLIESIFPLDWSFVLGRTRSTVVELPDKTQFAVAKFAPMGSALCFPIQCIVYSVVCIYAAILWKRGLDAQSAANLRDDDPMLVNLDIALRLFRRRAEGVGTGKLDPLRVYGDDILTDTRITSIVIDLLGQLGFEVNIDKSYLGSKCYRESCGKHYVEGDDVTPLYFRIKGAKGFLTPEYLASATELANHAYERGYRFLRKYMIHSLRSLRGTYGGRAILFTNNPNDTCAIYTRHPVSNRDKRVRWNSDYQQLEVRSLCVVGGRKREPKSFEVDAGERYLYMQWLGNAMLRSKDYDPMDSAAAVRYDMLGSALGWRWTPAD